MRWIFTSLFITVGCMVTLVSPLAAQELYQELQGVWRAEVVSIDAEEEYEVPGLGTKGILQTLSAQLLEGERTGEIVSLQNDYVPVKPGQKIYVNYLFTIEGEEIYSMRDVDRRTPLVVLAVVFALFVIAFGGKQGVRALLSLVVSFLAIIYILLPLLLKGYSPVLVSMGVGAAVLFLAIYFTHGFNRHSSIAFVGTVSAVLLTGLFSFIAIRVTLLTGFALEGATFLNLDSRGELDLAGLLLGAIIVGVLGILDDVAITQVAVVDELRRAGENLSRKELYVRAIRVGREHVGALVNTLIFAYAGASLPILLLFSQAESAFGFVVNQELFATEIVRTIVGSVGLILAVPITTLLAVYFGKPGDKVLPH